MSHHDDSHDEIHDHDLGLSHDLPRLLSRRRALSFLTGAGLAGAGLITLAACGDGDTTTTTAASTTTSSAGSTNASSTTSSSTSDDEIPEETSGPYPGDGSNGPNVLTQSGIVRQDITTSFGSASGVASGVPLTIKLTVLNVNDGSSAPYQGAAVYLWHCDRDGKYSMYSDGVTDENYLRGVQAADSAGLVTFTSIYPACYSGRWPHIHFEVYPSLEAATSASDRLRTSQLALPEAASKLVYATDGYEQSVTNLSQVSLATDNIFSDGYSLQLGTITGDVSNGMTVTLNVPV